MKRNVKRPAFIFYLTVLILQQFLLLNCSSTELSKKTTGEGFTDVKVMTFNILKASGDFGENNWQFRKNILFDLLRDNNADVIGFQEAEKLQIDEILEELPTYSYVGVGRADGKTAGEYVPIFFSKERFILDTTETFWLSDTPKIPASITWDNKYPRICTWAKLFDKFSGKEFFVINVHLDHISKESRIKSAEAVIEKIKTLENLPVIITGDFNSNEDEETIRILKNYGFVDSFRKLNPESNNEGTFNGFNGTDSGDRIDFIFVSKNFNVISSEIIKTNRNGKYPSDHFPVMSKIGYN